jgi:hypothetical protein
MGGKDGRKRRAEKIIVGRMHASPRAAAGFRFYGDGSGRPKTLWGWFCSDLEKNGNSNVRAICAAAVDAYTV